MAKAIFVTKRIPTYDDLPERRYHFPRTYLNQARETVGDWILYYEPRRQDASESGRLGRSAYFATAKVTEIVSDPSKADHYYALVSDFLEFDRAVPFLDSGHYYESSLRKADGSTNKGQAGRSIRLLPDHEYDLILAAGFQSLELEGRSADHEFAIGFAEPAQSGSPRRVVEALLKRPFRDRAFSRHVKRAYDDTCAVTGLKLINGGGRSEVDGAHIRPVGDGHDGPDSVRNGIALSKTVHWMFDRGLIGISNDYRLLVGRAGIPSSLRPLVDEGRRLIVPIDPALRPHPAYLDYHRDKIFKE